MKNNYLAILLSIFVGLSTSCTTDEEPKSEPAEVGFNGQTFVYHESDQLVRLPVYQSTTQFPYTYLGLSHEYLTAPKTGSDGVRFPWGDSVYVMGGYQFGALEMVLADDAVKDGNDTLELSLNILNGNVVLDPERAKARVIVVDDEGFGPNQMNIHATWYGVEGKTWQSEVDYDIDLYLAINVVETEEGLEDYDVFDYSANLDSFEDIMLPKTAPDQDYYIIAYYNSNTRDKENLPLSGRVELSGFGYSDTDHKNYWTFEFPEVGYYSYRGPFRKVGSTFVLK
jgi:hypothetical protein